MPPARPTLEDHLYALLVLAVGVFLVMYCVFSFLDWAL